MYYYSLGLTILIAIITTNPVGVAVNKPVHVDIVLN